MGKQQFKNLPLGIKIFLILSIIGIILSLGIISIPISLLIWLLGVIQFGITVWGITKSKSWTPAFYLITGIAIATLSVFFTSFLYGVDIRTLTPITIFGGYIAPIFWGVVLFSYQKSFFKN